MIMGDHTIVQMLIFRHRNIAKLGLLACLVVILVMRRGTMVGSWKLGRENSTR
jgi:hypothetical protein